KVLDDRPPDEPLCRILRCRRLAPNAEHRSYLLRRRLAVASEEDHRRGAMPRNVRARRVDEVRELDLGQERRDELLSELALHEGVRGDHPDVARSDSILSRNSK